MHNRHDMIKEVAQKYGIGSEQDRFFRDLCISFSYTQWNNNCIAASYAVLIAENVKPK